MVYNHILNKTVKSHKFKSRQKLHPLMISFVDYSGSRFHQHKFTTTPHLHSLVVIHPDVQTRFNDLVAKDFRLNEQSRNTSQIREIDVRPIEVTDKDIETVIDYSAKSYFLDFIPLVSPETNADMMIING